MSLRFKRNYPILLILVLVVAILVFAFGSQRVIAYTVDGSEAVQAETITYSSDVALFDDTVVHNIQIIMSDSDYDLMVTTYQQTGEKDYFHADIIIDGVRINDVGIRLKGNASLMTALGGTGSMGNMPAGPGFDPGNPPEDFDAGAMPVPEGFDPNNLPEDFDPNNLPQMAAPGAGQPNTQDMFGGIQSGETKVPFLIKFDEFVDGQNYQGYTFLAIRTYGASYDAAMLQEPLTNYAFELAGLPATRTAYAGVQLNEDAEQLYVLSEILDETYLVENFSNPDGVLYKAELGSTLSYIDEDPSSYATSFTQETLVNEADMAPLIEFIRFLSQSDDATFERELPDTLDVDSFATYLALNALLVNNDSIIGMNNNYYLYYDNISERFTLLMWDANESLGKLGGSADFDLSLSGESGMRMGMDMGGENILLERFLSIPAFEQLYEEKLQLVYEQIFLSGMLTDKAEEYSALIHAASAERDLVDLTAYDAAVESTRTFIDARLEYLQTTFLGQ